VRIEKLRASYNLRVRWVHFPLHPETPPEGLALAQLFAGREHDLARMKTNILQVAEAEGLPMSSRSMTYNSRLAQEMALWAETQAGGEGIHDALFRAYFVEGVDVSSVDALTQVAADAGLAPEAAREAINERRFRDAVDEDWKRSRLLGVTAVPTFVAAGRGVVGAQPYEALEGLVLQAGAPIKPPS
jgi:predicted DsbA family dithiol-disulfide isomerase